MASVLGRFRWRERSSRSRGSRRVLPLSAGAVLLAALCAAAAAASGTLYAWGDNSKGQLGVAVMAAGTGLVALARRRRRRGPPV